MDAYSGSTSSWDYLDFELDIRGGGPREYPVAVRSPAGEAQAEMRFPFDEWELKDRLQALEIALLRSGGTRRRIASAEEHTVQDFGRGLFESLLVGDVRTRYEMSLSEARRQGKGLRLKLRIQPSELAVLPWEFLYDAERDRYPSLSSNTPLVRYLDLPQSVEPLRVSPPLRVLGMVASPSGLDPLDVKHERRLVEEAIKGLREDGLLEITWLEGQTWRHLMRAMRRGPWHIFHFVGHGGFDPTTEEGAIALSNDTGHMHLLRARSLAELLDDHYPLRLVFLNSCEGARGSESDAFSSTAATLVRRGVPAVVAMQYEITDKAAIEFSRDFYEALADSLPVDAAVTEARAAVSMDSVLEWGTPVLYMHSPDGRVFDVLAAAPRAHPPPETRERQEVDSLRRYREDVESAWIDGKLQANEVQRLRDLANNELRLSPVAAADIEREVIGDTIEAILKRQQQTAEEEDKRNQLDQLYAQARRAHQNQGWQAVADVFEQISKEDPDYPDAEGLLQSALEALKSGRKEQDALRRYREAVKSTSKEGLNEGRAQSLRDLANKLELSASAASRIEQEVMDDTKEAILERLEGLYDEARQLYQNREWQAVIDIFARIYLEDANYPDPEGLLASAHEALETASKEEVPLRQYREVVESVWADGELDRREVDRLRDLADKLNLSLSHTGEIERTVIGDTKEAILESQVRAAKERYRNVVEEAWADNRVSDADTAQLGALARELDLSMDTVVDIEREVMGETKEEALERQEREDLEKRLKELYAQARRSHQDQEWQAVVDVFDQIHSENLAYPDPEGLLASASEALEAQEQARRVAAIYSEGQRHMDAREWQEALQCLEEVQLLEPGYRDAETLLSLVRRELTPPTMVEVPNLSGQVVSQALSTLANSNLKLGGRHVAPSDTIPEGQIIKQRPASGTKVQTQSSVSVTVSTGTSPVEVPNLAGKRRSEVRNTLHAANLIVGMIAEAPSGNMPQGRVVQQYPAAGSTVERNTSVRITISSGPQEAIAPVHSDKGPSQARVELGRLQPLTADRIQCVRMLTKHKKAVNAVAFSPDGQLLASCSGGMWRGDDTVRVWRVEDGELLYALKGHTSLVTSIAFSSDGELLASGSGDTTVRLWRVQSGEYLRTMEGHRGSVESVAFSPDGELLASGSYDRMVRLWRVQNGEYLRTLEGHTSVVASVAFSPSGELLASGSEDKTVRLWGLE